MYKAKIGSEDLYDDHLPKAISAINRRIVENNDDFLCLIVGSTGSGKSTLMLHMQRLYCGEKASVNDIALSRPDFAMSLKRVSESPMPRFLANDEANVSKRDALTKFNRELLDLYFSIRGKNIFHVWCNPSLEMIDKAFIWERLDAVIVVFKNKTKQKDKNAPKLPRRYYYFKKEALIKIFNKYESLKINILSRYRRKYATYTGSFRDYNGNLKKEYLIKKDSRMETKIVDFYAKYGINDKNLQGLKTKELCKMIGISNTALVRYIVKGVIVEGDDFNMTSLGHRIFKPERVAVIKEKLMPYRQDLKYAPGGIV